MHESSRRAVVHAAAQRGNSSAVLVVSSWSQKYSVSPAFCPAHCIPPAVSPTAPCVPLIFVIDE